MSDSVHPFIAGLIADLGSPSAKLVTAAAGKLARAHAEEAIPSLLRTLVDATDPMRAHAAAEALAGLRVAEAVPLILDKIESPLFAYYGGSLVFHAVELDCRAHLDRLAAILVRDGVECCMNAYSHFEHRRGPISTEIEQRSLRTLGTFADEYQAGGHRSAPSRYHAAPEKRWRLAAAAHDLVLEWNDREHAFPRKGENRWTGCVTPDWTPISLPELQSLIDRQLPDLDTEDRGTWNRIAVPTPTRIAGIRQVAEAAPEEPAEAYLVGRAGARLLLYDDVQDVFTTTRLEPDGSACRWGADSENLDMVLPRFDDQIVSDT